MSAPQSESEARTPVLATAVAAAAGLAAFEIAGLAARDGLFLSQLPASQLPKAMLAAAVVSLGATLGLSQWLRVWGPERVAPLALVLSAVVFAAIGATIDTAPSVAAGLLYVHVTGIGPVVASSFWSVVNERFDPYQAKRVVARMAAAAALGGVAGGVTAERIATLSGIPILLFVLAAICCACAVAARRIGSEPRAQAEPHDPGRAESGLGLLRRIPLLRQMAVLMLLVAVVDTLVDYALKAEAARSFQTDESLVRFFAFFYASCGLLSFGIQTLTGDRLLRRFGLAGAVAMLPGFVAVLASPGMLVAKLWTVTLARAAENVASTAFFRAGFQLLYTPMATAVKRPAKVWVDVAAGSLGDILGAGAIFALLFLMTDLPTEIVMAGAVTVSLAALAVVGRVRNGYVTELTDSLRRGRVEIRPEDALDRTTLQTIAHSQMSLSRQSLLEQVRAFDERQESGTAGETAADPVAGAAASPAVVTGDPAAGWITILASGSTEAVIEALSGGIDGTRGATPESRRRLVAWVIPLLEDDRLARVARDFLRPIAPRIAGQLADALLDPGQPARMRTRVAWVLGSLDDARAVDGLWRASGDDTLSVRIASIRAITRIVSRRPDLAPSGALVHAAAHRELDRGESAWQGRLRRRDDLIGERSVLLSHQTAEAVSAGLEHVFTLLAIPHERQLMASALAGLASDDPGLRGTALELLESVLPAALRHALWPRLNAPPPRSKPKRSQQQVAQDLLESTSSQVIDRDALKRS